MTLSNTLIMQNSQLSSGTCKGTVGVNRELVLEQGKTRGSYISQIFTVPAFTELVASWNSRTSQGTHVELSVRVRQDQDWSRWFSYGKWSDNGRNLGSIKGQKDAIALLATDLLKLREGSADALQYKLNLGRESSDLPSPAVRLAAFTWTPSQLIDDNYTSVEIALEVSPRAQLPIPEIGSIICSPTSLATVMAYHGYVEETEKAAAGARDNGAEIYGNWSYNVAYASEKGFTAWVQRCNSMEDVKGYLLQGLPVIASIRIKDKEELDGAQMAYPGGHLLVITGLTRKDGVDWVLVNDPAAHREEDVPRQYRLDQFNKAWSRRRIYVLQKN